MLRKDRIVGEYPTGTTRLFDSRAQLADMGSAYIPLDGQTVPRSGISKLLNVIQSGKVPVCTDAEWLADPSKRNCYTLGDGKTTIRVPDRNGKSSGTIGSVFARGDGDNSPQAGEIHGDAIREMTGTVYGYTDASHQARSFGIADGVFSTTQDGTEQSSPPSQSQTPNGGKLVFRASLQVPTAPQVRPVSISQVWAVKS